MKTLRSLCLAIALVFALPAPSHASTGVKLSALTSTNVAAWSNLLYLVNGTNSYSITLSNLLESLFTVDNFNVTPTALLSGVGGALTNYTLFANMGHRYINAFTNVSVRAVMQTVAGRPYLWSVLMTNYSGTDRTFEFSVVTNRVRYAGTYGTNAPTVITNNTQLLLTGISDGTNTLINYSYFAGP